MILFLLIHALVLVGGVFILASLRFFILAMLEKDRTRAASGVRYMLWGIGLVGTWWVIMYSIFSGIQC